MSLYLGNTPIAVNSSSRNIGEIIQSTIPLTDAGLHLLDGSLISGSGSYSAFVTYIAGLVSSYPDLFETEANWQTSVTNYGVCGKFVYDSVNNTVRLPKRASEHGDLIKSYSSGSDWYRIYSDGWCEQGGYIPEQTRNDYYPVTLLKSFVDTNYSLITNKCIVTNATAPIAAYSFYTKNKTTSGFTTAVDPNVACSWQASGFIDVSDLELSPVYEYIVIATSVKTDIEVDIDEVLTDLNGKADADLSNTSPSQTFKENSISWVLPDYSSAVSFTSGSVAVCDGWIKNNYTISNGTFNLSINGVTIYNWATSGAWYSVNQGLHPVKKGDIIVFNGTGIFYPCKGAN